MRSIVTTVLVLAVGCGSGSSTEEEMKPDAQVRDIGTVSLTGEIAGISLSETMKSAYAFKDGDQTVVIVSDIENYCRGIQLSGGCLGITHKKLMIRGTELGENQFDLNLPLYQQDSEVCSTQTTILPTGGTAAWQKMEPSIGGVSELTFEATTDDGMISGTIRAPYCAM